jgi:hypothetical protein
MQAPAHDHIIVNKFPEALWCGQELSLHPLFRSWSFVRDFGDYRIDPVGHSQRYRTHWSSRAGVGLALLEAWLGVGNDCSFHRRFNDFDCITSHSCINGENYLPSKLKSSLLQIFLAISLSFV